MTESHSFDRARAEAAVRELLSAIGDDPERAGLVQTPARVAAAWEEFFSGVGADPLEHLTESEDFVGDGTGELVLLRDLDFRSMCEHHLLPVLGRAHIAYVPRDRIVGLSKIPRVLNTLAARPQLQERLTEQVADTILEGLDARGVLVLLEAEHGCVSSRGVRQARSTTVTVASRGTLADGSAKDSVLALIGTGGGLRE